mgnify:CR=1 FL=1
MATRRRTSATRKTAKSATPIVKESRASVKKVTTTAPKRVNKVTPKKATKVTEVTPNPATEPVIINLPEGTNLKKRPMNVETASKDTLNLEKLFKDYPRDGFALALLPLLLLEALTKEGLKLAGVIS